MNFTDENILFYIRVPDLISSLNLISGFISVICTLHSNLRLASLFIILAIIFDCCDGWIARRLNQVSESDFGKNMDSFADSISFGLAPSILLYQLGLQLNPQLNIVTIIFSIYLLLAGILRLARFNVIGSRTNGFIGLPIPTTALLLSTFYLSNLFNLYLAYIFIFVSSTLMISQIKYQKLNINVVLIIILGILLFLIPFDLLIFNINLPALLILLLTIVYLIPKGKAKL